MTFAAKSKTKQRMNPQIYPQQHWSEIWTTRRNYLARDFTSNPVGKL